MSRETMKHFATLVLKMFPSFSPMWQDLSDQPLARSGEFVHWVLATVVPLTFYIYICIYIY